MLRRALPYLTAMVVVALLYAGWTIYSRMAETQRVENEAAARRRAFDQKTLNMIGSELKITSFYGPAAVHAGEKALVCYSVANAKSVRMEPAIEEITPSLGRCVQDAPLKTTHYTLTAEDGAGHSVSQTIVVRVQ